MPELSPEQMAVLERLRGRGFVFAAFPLYEKQIGVKKGNCAVLVEPVDGGGMKRVGEASYLVAGNLSVRVTRGGEQWFVWKQNQVEATPERQRELERFAEELQELLEGSA